MYQCMSVYINVCMYLCVCCLEWDSKYSGGVNWRQKIDTQKGAVLATELKNNSCKLAKWTAQAGQYIHTYTYRELPHTFMHFLQTLRAYTYYIYTYSIYIHSYT